MGGTPLNLLWGCAAESQTLDLFQAKGDEFETLFPTTIKKKIGILFLWLAQ